MNGIEEAKNGKRGTGKVGIGTRGGTTVSTLTRLGLI